MRRMVFVSVFVAVFALGGTTALANNPNNDKRIGNGPGEEHCQGLYQAGVGSGGPSAPNGAAAGTPGYAHVEENDEEMCHGF
jgi:hypothetical protein